MKLKAKTILLVLVFAAPALLMSILVINKPKQSPKPSPIVSAPVPVPIAPHRHPGKERMLATLNNENLDQSIEQLFDDREQYFFPFAGMSNVGEDPQQDLEQMLSTRRSVKVLQEIESLPKSEGKAKCELLFSRAFQQHTNACRIMINWSLDPSAPPHHQDLLFSLMTLSATLLITADATNLDILEKQFAQLDQWRAEIEPLAKLQNRHMTNIIITALDDSVITPDYRLQVNVLRLAALRSGNAEMLKQVDEACAGIQMTTNTIPIVAWNAETTAYELLPDSPLDTSKGVTTYTFYDWSYKMTHDHANYFYLVRIHSNDLPAADEEKMFVKKLEAIVFHGNARS
jgi:hypothetical protein